MVCNLTIGKPGFEADKVELEAIVSSSELRKQNLIELVDKDAQAFNKVMEAYRLPKSNQREKEYRKEQIKKATLFATEIPFQTCKLCFDTLKDGVRVLDICNKNCISDVGVAVKLACAGLEGACINVKINLSGLDSNLSRQFKDTVEAIAKEASKLAQTGSLKLEEYLG